MEKTIIFVKENYLAVLFGLVFYAVFLFYTIEGNSICDCESTENYKPNNTGHSVTRFYHK
jgi:hypothetical protein